jgi:hypothetical protein
MAPGRSEANNYHHLFCTAARFQIRGLQAANEGAQAAYILILSQAWKDYKRGRDLRRQEQNGEQVSRPAKLSNANRNRGGAAQITSPEQEPRHPRPPAPGISDHPRCQRRGWKNTGGEYPWRIERTIPGDGNWRGTWILEVKDMFAMEWDTAKVVPMWRKSAAASNASSTTKAACRRRSLVLVSEDIFTTRLP